MHQDPGDVDLDRADLVARAAEAGGERQRARLLEAVQLRREYRADRPGIDGPVGVSAGARVDGADIQAGGQRMQRSAWRPTSSASTSVRPLSSSTRWNSAVRRQATRPSRATCRGSSAHRWRSAAAAGGRPRSPASVGTSFSMPMTVTSTSGSVVHMRPLPSDSTTQTVPGLRDREVRAAEIAHARVEELPAQVQPRCLGELRRGHRSGPARPKARANRSRISARFLWIAGTRMCDCTSSPSWMISSAKSVSMARRRRQPARRSARSRRWRST